MKIATEDLKKILDDHANWRICKEGGIRANLTGAYLTGAKLIRADLDRADLTGTCLDPKNKPSGPQGDWTRDREFLIAYRTRKSMFICKTTQYLDGQEYVAQYFSTAQTECHPGLYISQTLTDIKKLCLKNHWHNHGGFIHVKVIPEDIHHAGDKIRCRKFTVIGGVK